LRAHEQTLGYFDTSSAAAISDFGMTKPSSFAVPWLMTSSNLLTCTTGMSAGFAPLKI